MYRKQIFQYRIVLIAIVLLVCGGVFTTNLLTDGSIVNRLKRLTSFESKDSTAESIRIMDKILLGLDDIKVEDDKVTLVAEKDTMQILMTNDKLSILDNKNKEIVPIVNGNSISFADDRFKNIKLSTKPEEGLLEVYYNDYDLIGIVFTKDGFRCNTNRWMTYRGNKSIETFGFKGLEAFASNRGYIWSRTIPLLKNAIFIGYGPDTFPVVFPQYDYIGKLRFYGIGGIFVDKAHNMYLQTAMNSGVLSLAALFVFFAFYTIASIRIYFMEKYVSFLSYTGLACFTAFCGYMVAGLFNDSVISVAPVFWVLLGLGVGINLQLNKMMKQKSGNMLKT